MQGEPAKPIAEVRDLVIEFATRNGKVRALDGVDFIARPNESIGLIGESGSGKSTLAMGLGGAGRGSARPLQGTVRTLGRDVFAIRGAERRRFLSEEIGFVFQNPIGSLDPTRRIGRQFLSPQGRLLPRHQVAALLASVGLRDSERVIALYPHEVSGGMAQRICIALAIAPNPLLLVADEPTAALDASVRTQILDLLTDLRQRSRATLVLVSHDLHAVRRYCDRICVMYAGRIVEAGPTQAVLDSPRHPYTAALLRSVPGAEGKGGRIEAIPGNPPATLGRAMSCAFAERCNFAMPVCRSARPEIETDGGRSVCCFLASMRAGDAAPAGNVHARA